MESFIEKLNTNNTLKCLKRFVLQNKYFQFLQKFIKKKKEKNVFLIVSYVKIHL